MSATGNLGGAASQERYPVVRVKSHYEFRDLLPPGVSDRTVHTTDFWIDQGGEFAHRRTDSEIAEAQIWPQH